MQNKQKNCSSTTGGYFVLKMCSQSCGEGPVPEHGQRQVLHVDLCWLRAKSERKGEAPRKPCVMLCSLQGFEQSHWLADPGSQGWPLHSHSPWAFPGEIPFHVADICGWWGMGRHCRHFSFCHIALVALLQKKIFVQILVYSSVLSHTRNHIWQLFNLLCVCHKNKIHFKLLCLWQSASNQDKSWISF